MKPRTTIIGIVLLSLALGSQALTLGRIRGAALVGKPLDVSVQVQLDASESASSLCFDADVFHADTRQESSRVRVQVEASTQAPGANVRILSSALIDEPVVTVYLRAGCSQKATRRYVLLADMPSEVAAPVPAWLGAPYAPPLASPPSLVRRFGPPEATQPTAQTDKPAGRPAKKTAPAAPKSVMASVMRQAPRTLVQPRLKLDLFELREEHAPTLNFSTELLTQPSGNPQRRAEAAALWLAVNASPEETLRQSARLVALEADVNALKTLTAKNQLGLTDLGTRLHKAESERFSAWVVYALVAALLASLAALAFGWRRARLTASRNTEWWSGDNKLRQARADAAEVGPAHEFSQVPKAPETPARPTQAPTATGSLPDSADRSDIDFSLDEVSHSIFDELMQAEADQLAGQTEPATPTPMVAAPTAAELLMRGINSEAPRVVSAPLAGSGARDQSTLTNPPLSHRLDLDLSESALGPLASWPNVMTDEPAFDAATAGLARPPKPDNMLDFDSPEMRKPGQAHAISPIARRRTGQ